MHALLIAASPSERSRSAALLEAAGLALEAAGVGVRRLTLRELPAEALLSARTGTPELAAAPSQVANASAVVFATPIYKAAYSGLLKVFLDLLPQDADGRVPQIDAAIQARLAVGAERLASALAAQHHLREHELARAAAARETARCSA